MQIRKVENTLSQTVVAVKDGQSGTDGCDQVVVDGGRDIIAKERGFTCGGIVARLGKEDIPFDGTGKRAGERVPVGVEFRVELPECGPAHLAVGTL